MKRSGFKRKGTVPMKRSGFKTRIKGLQMRGVDDTSVLKENIQDLVREIVILRDDGCVFKKEPGHICSGFAKDGHLILQADHLITRGNSGTFADTRLIVCVCKGIHGWKSVGSNMRKAEYDIRVKKLISPDRLELWDEWDKKKYQTTRMTAYDWKLEIVNLKNELAEYRK